MKLKGPWWKENYCTVTWTAFGGHPSWWLASMSCILGWENSPTVLTLIRTQFLSVDTPLESQVLEKFSFEDLQVCWPWEFLVMLAVQEQYRSHPFYLSDYGPFFSNPVLVSNKLPPRYFIFPSLIETYASPVLVRWRKCTNHMEPPWVANGTLFSFAYFERRIHDK